MPFPSDEVLMKTAVRPLHDPKILTQLNRVGATAHAKGELLSGSFTPSTEAKKLSSAPHFNNPTPVTVRFSNSTGVPNIPDNDDNANPRGIGIRFLLGDRKHTDIIAHSIPFFPTRTGAEFLQFLQAAGSSPPDGPHPSPIEKFLGGSPSALAFVTAPKPPPASYATQQYFSVSAFKLIDADGKATSIRYHVVPDAGVSTLDAEAVKAKDADYLQKELVPRLEEGPIGFKILAQVAEEGDVTDDATVHWPESRKVVELGSFKLDSVVPDNAKEQKYIIFDPIPRVQGVEPSDDPLLEMRAAIYLISGKQRRAA
ncbi:Catalase-related peroxidase [Lachnellula suecica]|uniref:Catalase-related peroxidase n=1 Tax=Lachnellula suecica TaxID=602035 RepID=A0A8T9CGV8_9HELO|nr:Catalase-related peroxidase [Lachnellula suecica]